MIEKHKNQNPFVDATFSKAKALASNPSRLDWVRLKDLKFSSGGNL
jgi:hypothetical protein